VTNDPAVPPPLQELQRRFAEGRADRMAELHRLLARAAAANDAAALADLRSALHRIAGSAGLFGFPKSGTIAREGERLLDKVIGATNPTIPEVLPDVLGRLTNCFEEEAERLAKVGYAIQTTPEPEVFFDEGEGSQRKRGRACIVSEWKTPTVDALERELVSASYQPEWVNPNNIESACPGAAVVLVDAAAATDGYALCRRIADLPNAPCLRILYTEGNNTFDLLRMSPSRAHRMVHRPFELRAVLRPEATETTTAKGKILSVEDDPNYIGAIGEMLRSVGHTVRIISRPDRLLEELTDFRPELLLLDWDLPQVSGYDLARIVRSDARHELLPIIFVTARTGKRERRAAARAGADDFLTKPFTPDELVETVDTQLRRHRVLRRRLESDSLTELLNRASALSAIEDMLAIAEHRQTGILLAIIDVDHFKRVNDELGHPAGDRVLREMAAHLRASLRAADVAGRLGGEEMIVAMEGQDKNELLKVLDSIRESLRIELRARDGGFLRRVTFSAGAAYFPEHGSQSVDLLKVADRALYEAKSAGRDRCILAS
jgi:diguanylate cyclase (GGDEF)-like protein